MTTPSPPPWSRRDRRTPAPTPVAPRRTPKAGRDLPMAIAVGVGLGALVLASLLIDKRGFVVVATLAAVIGAYELLQALRKGGVDVPVLPVFGAAVAIPVAAFAWGPPAVAPGVVLAVLAVVVAAALGTGAQILREAAGGVLIVVYPIMLVAFALLLLRPDDGVQRIATFIVVTICSDIGGYAAGVVLGKHPMAPSVSPKKSWEGFAGSALSCVVAGVLCVTLLLDGAWWIGVILGLLVVVAATVGDLCESMIKRDLGIKDMSNLIPGHGGLMDRLDSLALSVPVTWAILTFVSAT